MNSLMTLNTLRLNVQPMLWQVAFMVVLLCLTATGALEGIGTRQLTGSDSAVDRVMGFYLFGIVPVVAFSASLAFIAVVVAFSVGLAFVALPVSLLVSLVFGRLVIIGFHALFTLGTETVLFTSVLRKLRSFFKLLASTALFCYDLLRHNCFLVKQSC